MDQKLKDIYTENLLPHKKDIIKAAAQICQIARLFTFRSTVGAQQAIFVKYHKTNPNYGDRLMCICRAIHSLYVANTAIHGTGGRLSTGGISADEQVELFEYVEKKWWKRILSKYSRLKKPAHNTITEDMKELLARGFVHYEDIEWEEPGENWILKDMATNLTYPKEFLSYNYAIEFLVKYAVPGCTIIKQ